MLNYKRFTFSLLCFVIVLLGGLSNMLVVAYNYGYMPVHGEFEGLYDNSNHKPSTDFNTIKFDLLSDRIPLIKGNISIGDVLIILGTFTLLYNLFLLFFREGLDYRYDKLNEEENK